MHKIRFIHRRDHFSTPIEVRFGRWLEEERLPKKRRLIVNATAVEVPQNLNAIVADIWSDDPVTQLDATTRLCTLLSIGDNPPIEQVVQSKTLDRLVEFLDSVDSSPKLQLQAAWALTNIASGTTQQTQAVIYSNAVSTLVKLLFSASSDVCEQAVWALGNIAGDSPQCRDLVVGCGALMSLDTLLQDQMPLSMIQKATWMLCSLCRGTQRHSQTRLALEHLKRLVLFDDEDILTDTCWALYYLLEGRRNEYQAVSDANVLPRLLELLRHHSRSVNYAALCAVGNLVRHDVDSPIRTDTVQIKNIIKNGGVPGSYTVQIKNIIKNGGLPLIRNLLTNKNHTAGVKKEACWIISRITAGSTQQIQAVIDAKIMNVLVELVKSAEFCVVKEAILAIKFVAFSGTYAQVGQLVERGCLEKVCELLGNDDPEVVIDCLELINYVLMSDFSVYGPFFRSHAGDQLRDLQQNESKDIQEYAEELLQGLSRADSCIAAQFDKSASLEDKDVSTVQVPSVRKRSKYSEIDVAEARAKVAEYRSTVQVPSVRKMSRYSEIDVAEARAKVAEYRENFRLVIESLGMTEEASLPSPPSMHHIPPWLRK